MQARGTLRICLVSYLLVLGLYGFYLQMSNGEIAPELEAFLRRFVSDKPFDGAWLTGGIFLWLLNVLAATGLFFYKFWARELFLYTTVCIFLLGFFLSPAESHPLERGMGSIYGLFAGVVLGLSYAIDVKPFVSSAATGDQREEDSE